ncbi:type II secretion system protein [Paenibacillus sp. MMS20-IR301]|uniref:type II secretion system protein n=1 Tax=Paenibacillus sp. MMS20-IR301 TaxID=2895946 RepID=UPI0028F15EC6|nr:type II secretion system protein [Paenibacillus sp. MMS20-IR301]WNS42693.1 type II secretion system protein [Paenibacillus sp. MMS20-IR301]
MLAQAIKRRLGKEENQKGFTLIELLAVIVILGIIAVIAIPLIGGIINNSKDDSDLATARQIYEAARLYVIGERGGDFTVGNVTLTELQDSNYIEKNLVLPSTKVPITPGGTAVSFNTDGTLNNVMIQPKPAGAATGGVYLAKEILGTKDAPKPEDGNIE